MVRSIHLRNTQHCTLTLFVFVVSELINATSVEVDFVKKKLTLKKKIS